MYFSRCLNIARRQLHGGMEKFFVWENREKKRKRKMWKFQLTLNVEDEKEFSVVVKSCGDFHAHLVHFFVF